MAIGSSATIQVRDYDPNPTDAELGSVRVPSYQIDAANLATWLTGWGAYKTALEAISLGVLAKETVLIYDTVLSEAAAASPLAQREFKLRVDFTSDTLGQKFHHTVPCIDIASLTVLSKDRVDIADAGVMAAYVAAFEAIARSPNDDSETVTVTGARIVGRNT